MSRYHATQPSIFQSCLVMAGSLLKWVFVAAGWWALVYLYAQGMDGGF